MILSKKTKIIILILFPIITFGTIAFDEYGIKTEHTTGRIVDKEIVRRSNTSKNHTTYYSNRFLIVKHQNKENIRLLVKDWQYDSYHVGDEVGYSYGHTRIFHRTEGSID